jgi:two-component system sensor histidine kinase/response regulator
MKKLSNKIRTGVLGSLVLTSILTIVLVLKSEHQILQEDLDHNGKTLSQTVAAVCLETLLSNDFPYLETYIEKAARDNPHVSYIEVSQLADGERRLVARYGEKTPEEDGGVEVFQAPIQLRERGSRTEVLGDVEIGLSTERLEKLLAASTWQLLLGAALTFAMLALVLGKVLRRNVLDPVDDLARHATRIGSGDLEAPIEPTTNDELGSLALTMNEMRGNLKGSYEKIEREIKEKTEALLVAQQADKVKSQFLANMSHEIRTPINGVLGCLELALETDETAVPQDAELLDEARNCARSLLTLVDDILDIARIESRSMAFELGPLNPVTALTRLESRWREKAKEKGLELELRLQPELDTVMYTAPDEFERLVNNLVDNAIKFTSEGSVRIEASKPGSIEPAMIKIEIFDTGIGIPREKNEEIFLPFTQTDSSSTRKYGGAGLGLSVSRQFARLLGGDINVSSQPGRGSTFTIQLPFDSRQYRQSRPIPQDTLSG